MTFLLCRPESVIRASWRQHSIALGSCESSPSSSTATQDNCESHKAGWPTVNSLSSAKCSILGGGSKKWVVQVGNVKAFAYNCAARQLVITSASFFSRSSKRAHLPTAQKERLPIRGALRSGRIHSSRAENETNKSGANEESEASVEVNGSASEGVSPAQDDTNGQENGSKVERLTNRQSREAKRKARDRSNSGKLDEATRGKTENDNEAENLSESEDDVPAPPIKKTYTAGTGFGGGEDRRGRQKKKKEKKVPLIFREPLPKSFGRKGKRASEENEAPTNEKAPTSEKVPTNENVPTKNEQPTKPLPAEVGGSLRQLDAWERPLPARTRARTQKDRALRPAVENILKYWKDEKNKELGMTDELVQLLVELLDKYNAYLQTDAAPWGDAIEHFVEAVSGNRDEISKHLDVFVEEVRAFDMAAFRAKRSTEWADDVAREAEAESEPEEEEAPPEAQETEPAPLETPEWEVRAQQQEAVLPHEGDPGWQLVQWTIWTAWKKQLDLLMKDWQRAGLDPGELVRVEMVARGIIGYATTNFRSFLPEALYPLYHLLDAYEKGDLERMMHVNWALHMLYYSSHRSDSQQIEFMLNICGLYNYLAVRMDSKPQLKEASPAVKTSGEGLSGFLASGANAVAGVFGKLLGKKESARLIAELSESDDESDSEEGPRPLTQLTGRFEGAFRARLRARTRAPRGATLEEVMLQRERQEEAESGMEEELDWADKEAEADAVVLSWNEMLRGVVQEETVEAVRVLLDRWIAYRGKITDGVGVHESVCEVLQQLGAALSTKKVRVTDKLVTCLQQLILDGHLADDRALDAAVTILEDVVSNVIPGICSAAEEKHQEFADDVLDTWVGTFPWKDVIPMMKGCRQYVEFVAAKSTKQFGAPPATRAHKEKLYNILMNRMAPGGKKQHHKYLEQIVELGNDFLWGAEGLTVKQMEERMAEVRERASEQGPNLSESEGEEEVKIWVSDLTKGLNVLSEEDHVVHSWEVWLEEDENALSILRQNASAVLQAYEADLPESARALLEEELEAQAEVADVAPNLADVRAESRDEEQPSEMERLVQQMSEDGASQKGGAVEQAMEDPWETMKAGWGYPYTEEPWLVDLARDQAEDKRANTPSAGTMYIGVIKEVLANKGGALIVLDRSNEAAMPLAFLRYDFETVPWRYVGEEARVEKEKKREMRAKAKLDASKQSKEASESSKKASESKEASESEASNGSGAAESDEEEQLERKEEVVPIDPSQLLTERVLYQRHHFVFTKLAGKMCPPDLRDTIWATFKPGQYIVVQVEEQQNLWHEGQPVVEVSTSISITGPRMVLRPGRGDVLEVDADVSGVERTRLQLFLALNQPAGNGVFVRKEASGVSEVQLHRELQELDREWGTVKQRTNQKAAALCGPTPIFNPEYYDSKMSRQLKRLEQQDAVQARAREQMQKEGLRQVGFREELKKEGLVAEDAPLPSELAGIVKKIEKKKKEEGGQEEELGAETEESEEEVEEGIEEEARDKGPKVRREIIINAARTSVPRVALLEDGRLAEMLLEQEKEVSVGDVLLARVSYRTPPMQGLFVDVTLKKKGFCQAIPNFKPYVLRRLPNGNVEAVGGSYWIKNEGGSAAGPEGEDNVEDDVMLEDDEEDEEHADGADEADELDAELEEEEENGKAGDGKAGLSKSAWISQKNWQDVEVGDYIVVKCIKEPYGSKGPKVTAQLSLPGRFVVLTARGSGVHISSKIKTQAERQRLETLGRLLKPDGYRLLLRTESRAAKGKEIQQDIHQLQTTLEGILKKAEEAVKRNTGPLLLYKAMTPTQAIVRDLMSVEVERLVVDTEEQYQQIMSYLAQNNSEHLLDRVQLYSDKMGVMDAFGIEEQLESVFKSRVQLESGAYLVIQKTEALWAIDVNGGRAVTSFRGKGTEREMNLGINIEAAKQVAKELRTRDVAGIVVIDFIDMGSAAANAQVEKAMAEALKADRAKTNMGKILEPGNCMQILRSRLRENLATLLTSPCPLCTQDFNSVSAGRIPSCEAVLAEIERTIVRKEAEAVIVRQPDAADRPMANGRHPTWPTLWLTTHPRMETFLLSRATWQLSKTMAALCVNINVKSPETPIREYDFSIQISGRPEVIYDSAVDRTKAGQKVWMPMRRRPLINLSERERVNLSEKERVNFSEKERVIDVQAEEADVSKKGTWRRSDDVSEGSRSWRPREEPPRGKRTVRASFSDGRGFESGEEKRGENREEKRKSETLADPLADLKEPSFNGTLPPTIWATVGSKEEEIIKTEEKEAGKESNKTESKDREAEKETSNTELKEREVEKEGNDIQSKEREAARAGAGSESANGALRGEVGPASASKLEQRLRYNDDGDTTNGASSKESSRSRLQQPTQELEESSPEKGEIIEERAEEASESARLEETGDVSSADADVSAARDPEAGGGKKDEELDVRLNGKINGQDKTKLPLLVGPVVAELAQGVEALKALRAQGTDEDSLKEQNPAVIKFLKWMEGEKSGVSAKEEALFRQARSTIGKIAALDPDELSRVHNARERELLETIKGLLPAQNGAKPESKPRGRPIQRSGSGVGFGGTARPKRRAKPKKR